MMTEWQNRQQRPRTRQLAWFVSLLLLLLPLLTQAQWSNPSEPFNTSEIELPCHPKHSSHTQPDKCNHCNDAEQSLACDCCQTAVPLSLCMGQATFTPFQFLAELQILQHALEVPDPPPSSLYRPPIQRLI